MNRNCATADGRASATRAPSPRAAPTSGSVDWITATHSASTSAKWPISLIMCLSNQTGVSAGNKQSGQFLGHAQHRIMTGIELGPFAVQLFRGAALMCLAGIGGAAAPDHTCRPAL